MSFSLGLRLSHFEAFDLSSWRFLPTAAKTIYPFAFLRSFKQKSKWIPPAFQQITREYCTLEGCWDLVPALSASFTNKWKARKSPSLRCWVFRSPWQENTGCSLLSYMNWVFLQEGWASCCHPYQTYYLWNSKTCQLSTETSQRYLLRVKVALMRCH